MVLDYLAKFYAKLEGKLLVPAATVQKVCNSLAFLSEIAQVKLKKNLKRNIRKAGLDEDQIEAIVESVLLDDVLYNAHHKTSLCESLSTEHLRRTYFKKHFMYVEPEEINLNSRDPHDRSAVVQYVPVKETLEVMLQDPSVQEQVDRSFVEVNNNPNLIKNYTDGSVFKKRNVPQKRIDIFLFQDAFLGAANPLGSAKNKYKTLGVYLTVGNLTAEDRSRLVSKRLVELVYEELTREENLKDGLDKCFKKLVKDLKKLEETGIEYKGETIPVYVQFILGDNLGQHTIGGFLESFTAEYFCRFCVKTRTQYHLERDQESPVFREARWRSPRHFQKALVKIRLAPSYKGIKRNFVFHKLKTLNACDPSLPSCIGHDLFIGGVVDCDLASMIKYFVENKNWFSYKYLQKRIKDFKCKANDCGNKPAEIKKGGNKLRGHAVQNWCLLRILPFLIGEKVVDTSDPVWQLYLLLKSIVETQCAPALFTSQIDELQMMIDEYMMKRKILPNKYKPKHHCFSHAAKLWKMFGPLIHLWGMGFEQFHQFFKRVGRVCNNFINLLFMLANKHQLMQAYQSTGVLFDSSVSHVDGFQLVPESFRKNSVRACIQNANFSPEALVVKKLMYKDITLKPKQFLLLGPAESGVFVGKIEAIVHDDQDYSVIVTRHNANFWEHYGIHKIVKSSKEVVMLRFRSLVYPRPHAVYEFMEEDCSSLKHVFASENEVLSVLRNL
ncbi:hypothetical protein ONE63_001626 [Megalurothrips usitatus]|uniref:Uncharacterized protein n=1 Tax=Megalurothrips usitatus TaxID=439358 RepID=A0AAV7XD97_9NEOP|nr:hypothetical protein ONE63_001626 [Megalurothrips usitatus]